MLAERSINEWWSAFRQSCIFEERFDILIYGILFLQFSLYRAWQVGYSDVGKLAPSRIFCVSLLKAKFGIPLESG
ncbi:MAG: hypothetical protein C0507_15600 [Cyanobacteria bacterium PR.3.49]|nr:hypothetical protein [Cyanobacteria bacterium PR.3.49]